MVLDNILGHKDVDPDNLVGPLPFVVLSCRVKGEQYQLPLASSPQPIDLRRYPQNPPLMSHRPSLVMTVGLCIG